jgi:hypothetical protein
LGLLSELRKAGVRVVEEYGGIRDLGSGEWGVVLEELAGVEVKERDFGMQKVKNAFTAAAGFGVLNLIQQLKQVHDYIQKHGGIGDCQFFVSTAKGCVLFDPLTLNAAEKNGGPKQMIAYLENWNKKKD